LIMKEDNSMNEKEFRRYKASQDASMIVATAKLFFFNVLWKEISKRDQVRRLPAKDLEMVRRHLREAIASMDDTLFFFPPDVAKDKDAYERKIKQAFESGLSERIMAEFKRRIEAEDPTLSKYVRGSA
jgi:hypothetical protein